eukprot:CAMPEP_0181133634 /NCGR_PEP_ID=MMETSP1071-20121207/31631_1 /TAXON_ID=35127 /ORGANISM="Thalassiosira sp., Strain NH16" /LENGTH=323 /DNA_ID=CAMNT_0023220043 /DNA_START=98 /DNA_END=1069 /DNA_ORIENTATION=-
MSDDEGGCRFGWHPRVLSFFITAALALSIISSLDCKFLVVELGFIPKNYYGDDMGFGMWTYAAPGGRCLTYTESRESGGFSDGDSMYTNLFMNNDINWSISRILAVVGLAFGSIALISSWVNVCKHEPHLVDVLAYTTITSFMCECSKFGLFIGTDLCRSPDYWYNNDSHEFAGSKDCQIDRGAFMCMTSIALYFVSMTLSVGLAARPKTDDYTYEESSLPSWMASETGSSAKAHAIPQKRDEQMNRRSSIEYDWSRSAPSTIPSISVNSPIVDYGLPEEAPPHEERQQELRHSIQPIPVYPPVNNAPRRYDDMSTLTWDPGY